jgi:pyruvate dehydrogenase E2 component (dihydrolipoamide acetyltransferase)
VAAMKVTVPDIGDFEDVPVIEVLVAAGDTVAAEDPLIVLESDKASMEVPAPAAGVVGEVAVKVGDAVSQGDLILTLEEEGGGDADDADDDGEADEAPDADADAPDDDEGDEPDSGGTSDPASAGQEEQQADPDVAPTGSSGDGAGDGDEVASERPPAGTFDGDDVYAGPGARRLARQLGVDLGAVEGSGPKGRITKEDVTAAAESGGGADASGGAAPAAAPAAPAGLPAWPVVDFASFGPVEVVERSRIKRIAAPALARNWAMIPHVTQHDEADITALESFRTEVNAAHAAEGVKVTMVSLLLKACAATLRAFPEFNSSLDGERLVLKRYFHLGFAADTPQGLLVPVIRDVDRKGLLEIARELTELSGAAREGKLSREQMQGGTFTISSLGGIGGTAFTPIINAPEVAILGVSRSAMKPVWQDGEFVPRLMLPLSLSYDHRVVDGAAAARFTTHLADLLSDPRRMLL